MRRLSTTGRKRLRACAEKLEARRLLATWTFNGTAGADTISLDVVGSNVVITLNGSPQSMSDASVTDITINGLAGNDTIDVIRNSNNPTTINAGDNDDSIRISPTNQIISQVTAAVTINGQNGVDTLTLHDTARTSGASYLITAIRVGTAGTGLMNYGTIETFTLSASNLGTTITLEGTAAGTAYNINANDGADDVQIGNQTDIISSIVVRGGNGDDTIGLGSMEASATVSVIGDAGNDNIEVSAIDHTLLLVRGAMTIDGSTGTDSLTLFDEQGFFSQTIYTVTSSTVQTLGMGAITYTGLEGLTLNATSNHNNTINLESTHSGTVVTLNCGGGQSIVNIAPTSQSLSQVAGDVIIDGQVGVDLVTLFDNATNAPTVYTVTSTNVTTAGMGTITYGSIDGLTLSASNDPSFINLNSTAAGTAVTLPRNAGADIITIGVPGNPSAIVSSITVRGGAQDDTVKIEAMSASATLSVISDTDNDSIQIAPTNQRLTEVAGAMTIDGASGTDSLSLFDNSNPAAANYTITSNAVAMSGMGALVFSNVEALTLSASNTVSTINVNSTAPGTAVSVLGNDGADVISIGVPGNPSAIVSSITVRGGAQDDTVKAEAMSVSSTLSVIGDSDNDTIQIAPTNQLLNQVAGAMTIDGASGTDSLTLPDTSNLGAGTYTITSTTVTASGMGLLTYSGLESLTLGASNGASIINVNGTLAGTAYDLNANDGADVITVGVPGNPSAIVSSITVRGGAQDDTVKIEAMSASATLSVISDSGNDSIQVAPTNKKLSQIAGAMTLDGLTGTDSLTLFDNLDLASASYTVTASTMSATGMGNITYGRLEFITLNAGAAADTIDVVETAAESFLKIDTGPGLDSLSVNGDATGTAVAQFDTAQDLAGLTISTGGSLTVAGGGVNLLQAASVSMSGSGKLDLNDNDLLINYSGTSPAATVQSLINSARNGGTWNGAGITSSAARNNPKHNTSLGAMEAPDYKSIYGDAANFDGQPIDNTTVLVKYTYYGDADFNGVVNFDDYSRTDAGFNFGRTGWLNGDFDGNGIVNFDDYSLIDLAFNTQGPALRPPASTAGRTGNLGRA